MQNKKQKLIVIVGPTSSGKSDLAVEIAKQFNGEVISADSRQVYKGLDIGTGKITKAEMKGVRHHLLDVVDPKSVFTVVDFQKMAKEAISDIVSRGKLPIIAGGTGFYIQAVVDDVDFPEIRVDKKLREELNKESSETLFKKLLEIDPDRAESIDPKNKVRLIRAIEIVQSLGKVPKVKAKSPYDVLTIGIKTTDKELKDRIRKRLRARVEAGMIEEAEKLHETGLTYARMDKLGLEYRFLALFLIGEISKEEMLKQIETKNWQYAKRQKTWFKRDKRIKWIELSKRKAITLVSSFL